MTLMAQRYRKKLNRLLGSVDSEGFVQLMWAVVAVHSENPGAGRKFLLHDSIPKGLEDIEKASPLSVHQWEVETLVNEVMVVPKKPIRKNGGQKSLRWDHYGAATSCVNILRDLENKEYHVWGANGDVLVEMARIASRQFQWQRGYANVPQFYRNAFVYGQEKCAAFFEETHGLSVDRFSRAGFVLYASFCVQPILNLNQDWRRFGVTREDIEMTLAIISMPYAEAMRAAKRSRKPLIPTAYRPSILRTHPCVAFGKNGERVRCPLPQLILERITSGLYYDVVKGQGVVRAEYGQRFETYCLNYLGDMLPALDWQGETTYRVKKLQRVTPDILCSEGGTVQVVFECKATRMSHEAMYGRRLMEDRGFDDMIKAVFQIWQFFSHCRRGYADFIIDSSAVGAVLTLDNWLAMGGTLRDHVIIEAGKMADEKDSEITSEDRRAIVFVSIDQLERTLAQANEATFLDAISEGAGESIGWMLDSVHERVLGDTTPTRKGFPYADDMGKLLPWWDAFDTDARRVRRAERNASE